MSAQQQQGPFTNEWNSVVNFLVCLEFDYYGTTFSFSVTKSVGLVFLSTIRCDHGMKRAHTVQSRAIFIFYVNMQRSRRNETMKSSGI